MFTGDLTITGGLAVVLAQTSEQCQGGQQGDSVRFALWVMTESDAATVLLLRLLTEDQV
jgi:hypothetical protein